MIQHGRRRLVGPSFRPRRTPEATESVQRRSALCSLPSPPRTADSAHSTALTRTTSSDYPARPMQTQHLRLTVCISDPSGPWSSSASPGSHVRTGDTNTKRGPQARPLHLSIANVLRSHTLTALPRRAHAQSSSTVTASSRCSVLRFGRARPAPPRTYARICIFVCLEDRAVCEPRYLQVRALR